MRIRGRRVALLLAGVLPLLADDDVPIEQQQSQLDNSEPRRIEITSQHQQHDNLDVSNSNGDFVGDDENIVHDDSLINSVGAAEEMHDDSLKILPGIQTIDRQDGEEVTPSNSDSSSDEEMVIRDCSDGNNSASIDLINRTPLDEEASDGTEESKTAKCDDDNSTTTVGDTKDKGGALAGEVLETQPPGSNEKLNDITNTADDLGNNETLAVENELGEENKKQQDSDESSTVKIKKDVGLVVDYASKSAGALILENSASMKGASNLLTKDRDKYAISPCEDEKFVVIGLSEDILVKQVKIINYERFSSHTEKFQIEGSQDMNNFVDLGTYTASRVISGKNDQQVFDLMEPSWARYLKFTFLTHHGSEYYCTVTQIKVHGSTMLQGFQEQWRESEEETQKILDETTSINDESEIIMGEESIVNVKESEDKASIQKVREDQNEQMRISINNNIEKVAEEDAAKSLDEESMPQRVVESSMEEEASQNIAKNSATPSIDEAPKKSENPSYDDLPVIEKEKNDNNKDEEKASATTTTTTATQQTQEPTVENDTTGTTSEKSLTEPDAISDHNSNETVVIENDHEQLSETNTRTTTHDDSKSYGDSKLLNDCKHNNENCTYEALKKKITKPSAANYSSRTNVPDELMNYPWMTFDPDYYNDVEMTNGLKCASIEVSTRRSLSQPSSSSSSSSNSGKHDKSTDSLLLKTVKEAVDAVVPNTDSYDSIASTLKDLKTKMKTAFDAVVHEPDSTKNTNNDGGESVNPDSKESSVNDNNNAEQGDAKTSTNNEVPPTEEEKVNPENTGSGVVDGETVVEDDPAVSAASTDIHADVASILEKYPNSKCFEILNYQEFKAKIVATRTGSKTAATGGQGHGGVGPGAGKMEPIFKTLTDEIKTLQINQSVHDQFTKALVSCYQQVLLDIAAELELVRTKQEQRLSNLENAMREMKLQRETDVFEQMKSGTFSLTSATVNAAERWFDQAISKALSAYSNIYKWIVYIATDEEVRQQVRIFVEQVLTTEIKLNVADVMSASVILLVVFFGTRRFGKKVEQEKDPQGTIKTKSKSPINHIVPPSNANFRKKEHPSSKSQAGSPVPELVLSEPESISYCTIPNK